MYADCLCCMSRLNEKGAIMFQSFDLCDFKPGMVDESLTCFILSILAIFK